MDIASITIDGAPIVPGTTYRVVVNSYIAAGGDDFSVFTMGTNPMGGAVDVDALEAYFTANSPIAPPAVNLVQVLP